MRCRNCDGPNLTQVLDLGMQPWGNDFIAISENRPAKLYPLELFFCSDCAMVQIGFTIPKETMFVDHAYMSGTTKSLSKHFQGVVERVRSRMSFAPGQYVLDVGGNDGTFLRFFRQQGVDVVNVESGKSQAQRSRENGVFCINAFFNEALAESVLQQHGPARVVHGSGIFFHLEELHSVFAGIKRLLAKDGLLVAEFIYLPEMIRHCAFDQIYHEHLLYYCLTTFGRLLWRHGLEIHDCEFAPIHGGSCIAYIGHAGANRRTERLEAELQQEEADGFLRVEAYHRFADRVAELCAELRRMVKDLRSAGKRIFSLGAPVKGTTIVNACGWTEHDIECATEINELKVGTYIPGTRIPVVHQDKAGDPDVYLMLAWNFKDEILSRLGGFRQGAGKVLVPIPWPELI